ncbi:MAG: hypothetical protein A2428_11445 [Bdellovibrionales bacterium RIFOXYC1_FULL_54_43]|nr:MAG: hypothetical protein A2428_11445 [Bdellovibrionales bacterium RIFOXYC1_FULL_54_43]OFZ79058.1 MAG: hypothetical protein A2603_12905 [Bdellovibrionales bacterium RIFOXYD1_FULL_55_31]
MNRLVTLSFFTLTLFSAPQAWAYRSMSLNVTTGAPSYGLVQGAMFSADLYLDNGPLGLLGSSWMAPTIATGGTTVGTAKALDGEQLRKFANDPAVKELVAFVGGRQAECGEKYRLAARAISDYRQKASIPSVTSDMTVAKELLKGAFSSAAQ